MGEALAGGCLLAWLIALSGYDIRRRRLPNHLTLPGAVVIMVCAASTGRGVPALVGAAALFSVYAVVHLAAPSAMGAGDVKLAIGLGALTGAAGSEAWILAALAAPLLTAGWAVVALVFRGRRTVPHGPAMCLAAGVAVGLVVV